jgi:hypothetical protein
MGWLFVVAGVLGFIAVIALPLRVAAESFISTLIAAIVFGLVMSYVFWLRDPERGAENHPQ